MKCFFSHIVILLSIILASCSAQESDPEALDAVSRAAVRDAAKVAEAVPGSMEQQGAVLEIRVRENALRDSGFDDEADLYIQTVSHILVDSLHILTPCRQN